MPTALAQLRQRLAETIDIGHAGSVLHWDQAVMMPSRGLEQRADALANLARIGHEQFIAAETGRLIEAAAGEVAGLSADSDEVRMVRKAQRDYDKARLVPAALQAEFARAGAEGHNAWVEAREADDFKLFAPYLRRNLELTQRYVDCFDGYAAPYDVLLDDYDPGTTSAEVARLFTELKAELVPLIARLRDLEVDTSPMHAAFPVAPQRQLVAEVVRRMGFDPDGWRLDDTVHPFATSFGRDDVRITTRYQADYFPMGLYGAMHECGHGLYDAGAAPELARTILSKPDSLALHESQSRMWENFVGRGRPFCEPLAARLAALSGGSLRGLTGETLFKAVNAVTPSLVRIEADETTYGLHVILRFELEQDMIEGRVALDDLPEVWNTRMRDYLGVEVTSDADGVLQDVHWSESLIGYFPTYALGNLIAGQLWQKLHEDLPELDAQLGEGEFGALREWLRVNVHRHSCKFSSHELVQRVVGEPIEVGPFIAYLKGKLSDVYGLSLA